MKIVRSVEILFSNWKIYLSDKVGKH